MNNEKISSQSLAASFTTQPFKLIGSHGLSVQIVVKNRVDAVGSLVLETSDNGTNFNLLNLEYATPGSTTRTVVSGLAVGTAPLTHGGSAIINVDGITSSSARLSYLRTSGGAADLIDIYFLVK